MNDRKIKIIGGGLAGCEAALRLADKGFEVLLYEMRPICMTPAHETDLLGEIVCSNSFKSVEISNAHGLLKAELKELDCRLLEIAEKNSVPAGKALAVNRTKFAQNVTELVSNHKNISLIREEGALDSPNDLTIIASGPLTSDSLAASLSEIIGTDKHYFFDAVSPIVSFDSLDLDFFFKGSRYTEKNDDYLNLPLTKEEYYEFVEKLLDADLVEKKEFEHIRFFDACLPIEEIASRGKDSLAFGPFKPVGLGDKSSFAVIQFRKEDKQGKSYNLVGCQTRMTYGNQKKVFRSLPGMSNAEFLRLGSMHRNYYIDYPKSITEFPFINESRTLIPAGQITGVEGYVESIMSGLFAAEAVLSLLNGRKFEIPSAETMCGALLNYLQTENTPFQPMNSNFGVIEIPSHIRKIRKKKIRRLETSKNSMDKIKEYKRNFIDN